MKVNLEAKKDKLEYSHMDVLVFKNDNTKTHAIYIDLGEVGLSGELLIDIEDNQAYFNDDSYSMDVDCSGIQDLLGGKLIEVIPSEQLEIRRIR